MSVDSLLREQGQRLRHEARVALDVEGAWTELVAVRRRRRRVAGLGAASAVAATVVGVVALVGTGPRGVDREVPPADTPSPPRASLRPSRVAWSWDRSSAWATAWSGCVAR